MSTTDSNINPSEGLREFQEEVKDEASQTAEKLKERAKEAYSDLKAKSDDALNCSREYVRQHPFPVVLGALVFGVAVGYTILSSRRSSNDSNASARFSDAKEAILAALAPAGSKITQGYHAAQKAVHDYQPSCGRSCISDKLNRLSHNLKFW